jgi:hypothetical protein
MTVEGANPIAIIIPRHRVMGAKGRTGFSRGTGIETKVALLRHEKAGGFPILNAAMKPRFSSYPRGNICCAIPAKVR